MRRGIGISGLQRQTKNKGEFRELGQDLASSQLEHAKAQLSSFQEQLETFAQKYRKEIMNNAQFRENFNRMCQKCGVDPLQCACSAHKSFWATTLGIGEYYYELAVQILEICILQRDKYGALLELSRLQDFVNQTRSRFKKKHSGHQLVSLDDIHQAIRTITPLGNGVQLIVIGDKHYLQSVPGTLDTDTVKALEVAQQSGLLHAADLLKLGWTSLRVELCLRRLLQEGLCWLDEQGDSPQYYISKAIT